MNRAIFTFFIVWGLCLFPVSSSAKEVQTGNLALQNKLPIQPSESERLFRVGLAYHQRGDDNTAYNYWLRAARKGYARAQLNVGVYHFNGIGSAAYDVVTAFAWISAAAKQGLPKARLYRQMMIGELDPVSFVQGEVLAKRFIIY